jgi:hypothetical protein
MDFLASEQDDYFSLLSAVYGESLAKVLVYAKDVDGKTVVEDIPETDYYEVIESRSASYEVVRKVKKTKDDKATLSFSVNIVKLKISNEFEHYGGNYKSLFEETDFGLSDIVGSDIKNTNLSKDNFLDNFFDEYEDSKKMMFATKKKYTAFIVKADNGVDATSVSTEIKSTKKDFSYPKINLKYSIIKKNDKVMEMGLEVDCNMGAEFIDLKNGIPTDEERQILLLQMQSDVHDKMLTHINAWIGDNTNIDTFSLDRYKGDTKKEFNKKYVITINGFEKLLEITSKIEVIENSGVQYSYTIDIPTNIVIQ